MERFIAGTQLFKSINNLIFKIQYGEIYRPLKSTMKY